MRKTKFQNAKSPFQSAESCTLHSACIQEHIKINGLAEIQNAECKFCTLPALWKILCRTSGLRQNAECSRTPYYVKEDQRSFFTRSRLPGSTVSPVGFSLKIGRAA